MNEKNEEVIGWGTKQGEFVEITNKFIFVKVPFKDYFHACHCMIYANDSLLILDEFKPKATVLMQMRFDGHFGFPGGIVDEGETLIEGLNRELTEEIGNAIGSSWNITEENYVSSHVSHSKKLVVHFFVREITYEQLKLIESSQNSAKDFGSETMGMVRVPLYTMKDGFRGLPAFLSNNFIGITKEQLIKGLTLKNILTQDEISKALLAKPLYINDSS